MSKTLKTLTSAALLLPGLVVHTSQAADPSRANINFQHTRYQEGKRDLLGIRSDLNPIMVDTLHGTGGFLLTDRLRFSFGYTQDTWSGATPIAMTPFASTAGNKEFTRTLPTGEVVSGASPYITGIVDLDRNLDPLRQDPVAGRVVDPRTVLVLSTASPETRKQGDFRMGYEWDNAVVNFGGGLSHENDYKSSYGNVNGRFDFNQKLTSLKWGGAYTTSATSAILDHDTLSYVTPLAYNGQIDFQDRLRILRGSRQDWAANIGLTQVLGKSSLIDANIGYTHSSGFMENPYKATTVIFIDPDTISPNPADSIRGNVRAVLEQRPDYRNQLAISNRFVQHISPLDAALHLNYKFSFDDWGINAHTFESDWIQPLFEGWTLTPRIRYYSQSAADFYQPYLFSNQAFLKTVTNSAGETQAITYDPRKLPQDFASDHRLASFGSLSGGISLNKRFARGFELEAGFEYYTRASAFAFGGGNSSFADFDYYVANAALKIGLETLNVNQIGRNRSAPGAAHDHTAQHDHAFIPAGIMFGHTLDKAGDIMVGYRFMYARQTGDILRGSHVVSDLEIVNQACGDLVLCRFAPDYMNMRMHMLDIMYAPTRWLNLMLMPQFMDMEMNLRPLEGRPPLAPGGHDHPGTPHATGGVADTIMMPLIKLLDKPNHRLHIGLGFSAPTGSVDQEIRRIAKIDGGIIHFDMQLGSGTWDFMPNLTYTGSHSQWYWGVQLYGVKRLENQNESGYRLGDLFQASTWGGYRLTNWLATSVRGVYTSRGSIHGDFNTFNARIGPMDFPHNQGGQFWDLGIGINARIPSGRLVGNHFAFEWLQPLRDDFNGYQLERQGALSATWHYSF